MPLGYFGNSVAQLLQPCRTKQAIEQCRTLIADAVLAVIETPPRAVTR
jgi:hypothetical protein